MERGFPLSFKNILVFDETVEVNKKRFLSDFISLIGIEEKDGSKRVLGNVRMNYFREVIHFTRKSSIAIVNVRFLKLIEFRLSPRFDYESRSWAIERDFVDYGVNWQRVESHRRTGYHHVKFFKAKIRDLYFQPSPFLIDENTNTFLSGLGVGFGDLDGCLKDAGLPVHIVRLPFHQVSLPLDGLKGTTQKNHLEYTNDSEQSSESPISPVRPIPCYRHGGKFADSYGMLCIIASMLLCIPLGGCGGILIMRGRKVIGWALLVSAILLDVTAAASGIIGCLPWDWWRCLHDGQEHSEYQWLHKKYTVTQKYFLTKPNYRNTLIAVGGENLMANVLDRDKQIAVIGALAEGSSIRSIERITGVHRDTIMRLGVKVGKGCATMLDAKMRNLPCQNLQVDEIWGFIGKKERHLRADDDLQYGDVWTFCAIDADTKLVPSFKVGKRDAKTANAFVSDVASRLSNRVQISSDALRAYVEAVEVAFGSEVDYAQIIKTYSDDSQGPERKYSPSEFVSVEKKRVTGSPDMYLASTSYIERLNGTTRLHMRRLTRLTYRL